MSHLITLENVSLAYGLEPLLDHVKLQINKGERVCLIGRNGAGKSSLLKIIEGSILPDSGQVWRKPTLKMARLTQELPQDKHLTVQAFVAQGMAETGELLNRYEDLVHKIEKSHNQQDLIELEKLQHAIDAVDGWKFSQQIKTVLTKLNLNGDDILSDLSGGWQRRAALAKALVIEPELLLLDEPTNHLDLTAIEWMEEQLLNANIGLVFITHDRALLQRLATRIIELDRGQLTSWPGDYENFLRRKDELLHAEAKQNADFDKKLAQEEKWIRQGIKARRTRNEGRVRALQAMRLERRQRREVQGKASFSVNEGDKSGQLVVEAENVSHSFGDKKIIDHFSLRVMRGDRIGLLGPNGAGKSTLLNILLGNLSPQIGTVKLGTNLQIAYFDQLRQKLDLEKTVIDNVAEGRESVDVNGQTKHIISYLGDFLFSPDRARTPVKALSGGECNRLLFAKLFAQPANLLVLDEPTNDLDIETLELLEELLSEYKGTLLIVSHDRTFLDNVVSSTIVFEGNGQLQEYVGGYQDWLKQRRPASATTAVTKPSTEKSAAKSVARETKKLSYKEQRELAELPQKIEMLEAKRAEIQMKTNDAAFYKNPQDVVTQTLNELNQLNKEIDRAYKRWEQLEA
jgi:ATP-binding cassette subfamily F protein uup